MLTYWAIYLIPAFMALALANRHRAVTLRSMGWIWLVFVLIIGLRYEVGGDWFNYLRHYDMTRHESLVNALTAGGDPGYVLLNWIAVRLDLGIGFVNLLSAVIFTTGLMRFSSQQPSPWLALTIAVPYIVIVISMGYTRQGVALGFIFFALNALERLQFTRYIIYILLAALFHKTAMLMVPLGLFIHSGSWLFRTFVIVSVAYGLWGALLEDSFESMWVNYVDAEMQSQGAFIRIVMNLAPALALLLFRRQWLLLFPRGGFWVWMALAAVIALPVVFYASTAVDRMSLYLTPLQVVVLSRLPYMLRGNIGPSLLSGILVTGYAVVLFVWLNYATHAFAWLPYRNILLQ